MEGPLQSLVHASLGIHSLLKRQPLKHNVIDRDKIVVPPNWDSWAKVRVLRDGFDAEAVSTGWGIDLDHDFTRARSNGAGGKQDGHNAAAATNGDEHTAGDAEVDEPEGSAVVMYESQIQDSSLDALQFAQQEKSTNKLEVKPIDVQSFLAEQIPRLDAEKKADEQAGRDYQQASGPDEVISEHIGPVQFNMGGIQVDADNIVQRLKVRPTRGDGGDRSGRRLTTDTGSPSIRPLARTKPRRRGRTRVGRQTQRSRNREAGPVLRQPDEPKTSLDGRWCYEIAAVTRHDRNELHRTRDTPKEHRDRRGRGGVRTPSREHQGSGPGADRHGGWADCRWARLGLFSRQALTVGQWPRPLLDADWTRMSVRQRTRGRETCAAAQSPEACMYARHAVEDRVDQIPRRDVNQPIEAAGTG